MLETTLSSLKSDFYVEPFLAEAVVRYSRSERTVSTSVLPMLYSNRAEILRHGTDAIFCIQPDLQQSARWLDTKRYSFVKRLRKLDSVISP